LVKATNVHPADNQLINNQEEIDIDSSRVSFKQLINFVGLLCRHYFQVMLATSNAKFYIQMLPSRWYHTKENGDKELFLITDKFFHNLTTELSNTPIPCLYLFRQNDYDFREDNLITLKQKITYEFAEDNDDKQLELNNMEQDDLNDKENVDPTLPPLQNPKIHHTKGRPVDTKRFKSMHEVSKIKTNQRKCKKCEDVGHYQKNCKA
ncbi:4218_t:CDS:2, partial [Funneliformis geosporum]